jgi:KUP system potassium uptake protein
MSHSSINKVTGAGLLITLGIIFGDIGTSPLYVMSAIMGEKPISNTLILGGLSAVFWTLTLQTTIKYVILTLQADNKGEGGIFSLFSLLRRRFPYLVVGTVVGGAMLLADGIITPPISVASAVEGLKYITPANGYKYDLSQIETVPIIIAIICVIFLFQRVGTNAVGKFFGPIMLVWFSMLGVLGFGEIVKHPEVLAAFNPIHVVYFLKSSPNAFVLLGAVFLCTTGAEALYSDLGHCGKKNIRVSWVFVKISLLLNYFGQGAWLIARTGTSLNGQKPFYGMMPDWFLPAGIAIATVAAIIASQALISGSFTLVSEAIRLHFFPKFTVKFPTNVKGQIYIPVVNNALLIGCIMIVLIFKESAGMEAAYGLAITVTMLMTSILLYFYLKKQRWPMLLVFMIMGVFMTVETAFLIANLHKFADGGFVTLLIGLGIILVMYISFRGGHIKQSMVVTEKLTNYRDKLRALSQDTTLPKFATHLVYLSKAQRDDEVESPLIYSILYKRPKRADFYWFVNIELTDEPYTMEYKVNVVEKNDIIRVRFRLGFRVQQKISVYLRMVIQEMVDKDEIDLDPYYHAFIDKNHLGDFRFVLVDEEMSQENELSIVDDLVMQAYDSMKVFAGKPEKWFGLDGSVVTHEMIPVIIKPRTIPKLKRI